MRPYRIDVAFVDREREMEELRGYLQGRPNSILFLYGPKSSGKTTLMMQLFRELERERGYSIHFLNLRKLFIDSYQGFINAFFKTPREEDGVRTSTRRQYSLFGVFKLDALTERMLKKGREDPFLVMERELERLVKRGKRPVVIVDEFHKLDGIYLPDKERALLVELMHFFVAMTKESHLCHVIIASSDAFFLEQVYLESRLTRAVQFMKLDYLEREAVEGWLRDIRRLNGVEEYRLDEGQIQRIWEAVGGCAWEIYQILEKLFLYPLDEILARIRRERLALVGEIVRRRPEKGPILERFAERPVIPGRELLDCDTDLLGELVRDNLLFFDPVEGLYGVQGRSLELAVRDYFAGDVGEGRSGSRSVAPVQRKGAAE